MLKSEHKYNFQLVTFHLSTLGKHCFLSCHLHRDPIPLDQLIKCFKSTSTITHIVTINQNIIIYLLLPVTTFYINYSSMYFQVDTLLQHHVHKWIVICNYRSGPDKCPLHPNITSTSKPSAGEISITIWSNIR